MSLHAQPLEPIPDLTSRIARASFPKGTLAMDLRDALGPIYEDAEFGQLFPRRGRAAEAPWRLALALIPTNRGRGLSREQGCRIILYGHEKSQERIILVCMITYLALWCHLLVFTIRSRRFCAQSWKGGRSSRPPRSLRGQVARRP